MISASLRSRLLLLGSCVVLTFAACNGDNTADSSTDGPPQVYAVNYPLAYFAETIGGEQIETHFPAPPDIDPAFWTPDADTIGRIQKADLILLNGANYAKWTKRVSLPDSKKANTTAAVRQKYITVEDAVTHQHGPGGEHTHAGFAFTTWLDFQIAVAQARAVKDALTELLPDQAAAFQERFAKLEEDLNSLDKALKEAATQSRDVPLIGSHPVYQYLTKRYGLSLRSVHWEPDETPDEAAWEELEELLAEHPAKTMLWEGEPLPETRDRLADMGVTSIVYAPSGNAPEDGDFLGVMRKNVEQLSNVFE